MGNLIYGIHTVSNLLDINEVKEIFILNKQNYNQKIENIINKANTKNIKITFINNLKLLPNNVKDNINHQNIFALEKNIFKTYVDKDIEKLLPKNKNAFILILDNIQDPYNLGACIRSAHSAGIDFIIIPKDNSSQITATVKKVACGAVEHTKILVVTNLVRVIEKLKRLGIWVIGLTDEANDSLYSMDLTDPVAIIVGAEGSGMRKRTKSSCDFLVKLLMLGEVPSLNVSVAAGISLYETVRQRINTI